MEGKENLTEVVLEENPETGSTRKKVQAEGFGLDSSGGDAPGTGRARAPARGRSMRKKKQRRKKGRSGWDSGSNYPFEFRLRLVKMFLEEGMTRRILCGETGISPSTLSKWVSCYRAEGEEGLRPGHLFPRPGGKKRLPDPVKDKMVEIKREEPTWGVKKISQFMQRFLHLPGSAKTVQRTLRSEDLLDSHPPRPPKTIKKPRFFERATPNQLWQSDITQFIQGGKTVYLIGFMDDYSRYIVSLGVFHCQTAENVLETYRRGVGEYGAPVEMLTDNGRQYTNWRGKTRFEKELAKDKVHHFRSRPHHPQTLGKIEHFWLTIHTEFLSRARFRTFEEARERIAIWVKYYNHKRPHQGIGGMCPADRYFEVRNDLRKVIEQGIEDNLKEIALKGKPKHPFYMIGQVDGQSVVMQASKGKLLMTVGDKENNQKQEVLCDLENKKVEVRHENDGDGSREENTGEKVQGSAPAEPVHGGGEMPCGAGPVDGAELGLGAVQGAGDDVEHADPLAGTGDGGDGSGAGAEALGAVREHASEPAAAGSAGPESCPEGAGGHGQPAAGTETGTAAEEPAKRNDDGLHAVPAVTPPPVPELTPDLVASVLRQLLAGNFYLGYVAGQDAVITANAVTAGTGGSHAGLRPAQVLTPGREGQAPCESAAGGHGGEDNGNPGSRETGGLPQDLARMAGPRPGSPVCGDAGSPDGAAADTGGRGGGTPCQGTGGQAPGSGGTGNGQAYPKPVASPSTPGTGSRQ